MLAWLQRSTVVMWVGAGALWALWCHHRGLGAAWLWPGLLLALAPHAPVLALECVLAAAVGRRADIPAPSLAQWLRAWAGEVVHGWRVFAWRQPWAAQAQADVPPRPGAVGVVLVHGFVCNRGLWAPWLRLLRARGVPATALSLAPVFGRIDDWVPALDAAVRAMHQATGRAPLLVAHSMGGLAVRAWLRHSAGAVPVTGVVTVGTPHRGTWLARFGHSVNGRQMRVGGAWLQTLAAQDDLALRARFTCFFSHCDNIVFPAETATLAGADNRHLAGAAHVQMLFRPEVLAHVLDLAQAPAAGKDAPLGG